MSHPLPKIAPDVEAAIARRVAHIIRLVRSGETDPRRPDGSIDPLFEVIYFELQGFKFTRSRPGTLKLWAVVYVLHADKKVKYREMPAAVLRHAHWIGEAAKGLTAANARKVGSKAAKAIEAGTTLGQNLRSLVEVVRASFGSKGSDKE